MGGGQLKRSVARRAIEVLLERRPNAEISVGVFAPEGARAMTVDRAGREVGLRVGPAEWESPKIVEELRGLTGAPAR